MIIYGVVKTHLWIVEVHHGVVVVLPRTSSAGLNCAGTTCVGSYCAGSIRTCAVFGYLANVFSPFFSSLMICAVSSCWFFWGCFIFIWRLSKKCVVHYLCSFRALHWQQIVNWIYSPEKTITFSTFRGKYVVVYRRVISIYDIEGQIELVTISN